MRTSKTGIGRLTILAMMLAAICGAAWGSNEASELQRTWDAAWVFAPDASAAGYARLRGSDLRQRFEPGVAPPAAIVLHAHGCDGLSEISAASGRFLAQSGYLVVEPDSFARRDKPVSCKPARHLGGLHRAVLGWRHDEMRFAAAKLEQIKSLAGLPLILMGHSEGAIAVATIADLPSAARIVEGWTCHAGWPEYRGLAAPPDEPVLALVGADDPWFRAPVLKGDCGAFMHGAAQHSIVYHSPNYLAGKHWLSSDPEVRETIIGFIRRHTN